MQSEGSIKVRGKMQHVAIINDNRVLAYALTESEVEETSGRSKRCKNFYKNVKNLFYLREISYLCIETFKKRHQGKEI